MNTAADNVKLAEAPCTITSRVLSVPREGVWRASAEMLEVEAQRVPQLIDITAHVQAAVRRSGVTQGQVVAYCTHTTASLVLNEDEPLLHEDIAEFLEKMASSRASYRHDDLSIRTENLIEDHGDNGHAHLKQMVLGSVQVLPIVNSELTLGMWQRLFMLEMDRPKKRNLVLQVSGLTC
ncbi:MAG TPA: secondary thiamine-phosphate synthase enzyme YjbQ [Candidatus Xenobia bacterium]